MKGKKIKRTLEKWEEKCAWKFWVSRKFEVRVKKMRGIEKAAVVELKLVCSFSKNAPAADSCQWQIVIVDRLRKSLATKISVHINQSAICVE